MITLVLTTQVTHLCSLLFRQLDGVNKVFRRVHLAITVKQLPRRSSVVSGLTVLCLYVGLSLCLLTLIAYMSYKMALI